MIEWWGWLLIWVSLVLALVVVLVLLSYRLFLKVIALMRELSSLVDKTTVLNVEAAELSDPQIAVLAELSQVRAQYEAKQRQRAEMKFARHERRIARAKRITTRDASTAEWPKGWS